MAVDAFLSMVTGGSAVKGETQDTVFAKDAFEIEEYEFGVENPTTIGTATGGAGAGKARFKELVIYKTVDVASPALFQHAASGYHFEKAILSIRKAGGAKGGEKPYLTYEFSTVFITSITHELEEEEGEELPTEIVKMVFGGVQIKYSMQDTQGKLSAPTQGTWNQVTNKAALNI